MLNFNYKILVITTILGILIGQHQLGKCVLSVDNVSSLYTVDDNVCNVSRLLLPVLCPPPLVG